MLLIALPIVKTAHLSTGATWFSFVWIGFALLVLGAHLYRLLGVDEEAERHLQRIRREKLRRLEEHVLKRVERKQTQKKHVT
ncbi:hypothetical protein KIK04_17330 [Paenibacillus sp. 481]|nr:hypothetical protein KIK04_17330 [Paenibacillus sp. 481]